jgi:Mg-chelatase subunit ChlD
VAVVSALVSALVVSLSMVGGWFFTDGPEKAYAGTLEALTKAADGGRFIPLDGRDGPGAKSLEPASPVNFTAEAPQADGAESFLVQVFATAPEPARIWLDAGEEPRSAAPLLMTGPAGGTVAALIHTDQDGHFALVSDAAAEVSVTLQAAFTKPGAGGLPGPGGSAAIDPYLVLNAGGEAGPIPGIDSPALIAPAGLGGVDRDRAAGGWLQVTAEGEDGTVLAGPKDALVEVATVTEGAGYALVPTGLNTDGRVYVAARGDLTSLRVNLVGWTAGAAPDQDASIFEDGLVLGDLTAGGTPGAVPSGAVSLHCVQVERDQKLSVSGEIGGVTLSAPVTPAAGQTVLATDGTASGIWAGFFAAKTTPGAAPTIRIDSPAPGSQIELAQVGGEVVFSGSATAEAGLRSVLLRQGDRYIGAAAVKPVDSGWLWEYRTQLPTGQRRVIVEATDAAGQVGKTEAKYEFIAPASDAVVVSPQTVVAGDDFTNALIGADTDAQSMLTDTIFDLTAGDILVVSPNEHLPRGAMARIEGLAQAGDGLVIDYSTAKLTDAVRQIDYEVERLALSTDDLPSPGAVSLRPADSGRPVAQALGEPGSSFWTSEALSTGAIAPAAELGFNRQVVQVDIAASLKAFAISQDSKGTVKSDVSLKVTANGDSRKPLLNIDWNRRDEAIDLAEAQAALEGAAEGSSTTLSINLAAALKTTLNASFKWHVDWKWAFWDTDIVIEHYKMWLTQDIKETLKFAATGKLRARMSDKMYKATPAARATEMKKLAEADPILPEARRTVDIGSVYFALGPVPVVIDFEMVANAGFGAYADVHASGTQVFSATYDLGFAYENGKWAPINKFRLREESAGGQFDFTALLSAMPYLRFKGMLYGAAGLTLDLTALLELGAEASGSAQHASASESNGGQGTNGAEFSWSARLDLYLMGSVGAEIDFWGLNKHWNSKELVLAKKTLKEWGGEACAGDSCPEDESSQSGTAPPDPGQESAVGRGNRPLILMMDISGSMQGTPLDEAKQSMQDLLDAQRGGEEIGLYAYPAFGGGCDPGSFVVPVGPVSSVTDLKNAVDALVSSGGTPTGEALQAVVEQLEAEGRTGASIVLVSDGESNCSIDPCEMARQIRARGFEVSIPTVAFNISEAGRTELQCIADATESPAVEVQGDSQDELWELIKDLSVAEVEASLVTPAKAQRDSTTTVEVTISNPSARDLQAVRLSVKAQAGSRDALVKPSLLTVGNLRPGGSATRLITVDPAGLSGKVEIDLLAWADNADAVSVESAISLVDESAISYEPGELLQGDVVAVGDGFAGEDPIAVTDLAGSKSAGEAPVTVSIGAEEVGLAQLLELCRRAVCAVDDPSLLNAIRVAQEIDLTSVYERIATQMAGPEDGPRPLIVTAYSYLFSDSGGRDCSDEYSADEVLAFNTLIATLNRAADAAVREAQEDGYEVYFVADTANALTEWADLSLCSDADQGIKREAGQVSLTEPGRAATAKALARWSQGRERLATSQPPHPLPAPAKRHFLSGLFEPKVAVRMDAHPVASFADIDVTPAGVRTPAVKPGQELVVEGEGYAVGTMVTLMLYLERPVLLGTFQVGPSGMLSAAVAMPAYLPVGSTQLALLGVTDAGQSERLVSELAVEAPVPLSTALLLIGGVAGIVLTVILALVSIRARRRRVRLALS